MSALPPHQARLMREAAHLAPVAKGAAEADARAGTRPSARRASIAERWQDLHSHANRIARLAELAPELWAGEIAALPDVLEAAPQWQRTRALQGIEDIEAMIRPGLRALDCVIARQGSPLAPALALWREFHYAREALLALARIETQLDAA